MNETNPAPARKTRKKRGRSLVFVVLFVIIVLGLLVSYRFVLEAPANVKYLNLTTFHTAWLLDHIGESTNVATPDQLGGGKKYPACHFVLSPGRAVTLTVAPECGAIEVMAIFLAALIAFPAPWWKKGLGLLAGLPILYALNVVRVACLFLVGATYGSGEILDFVHHYVWQTVYIIFVVVLWLAWVKYLVERKDQ